MAEYSFISVNFKESSDVSRKVALSHVIYIAKFREFNVK